MTQNHVLILYQSRFSLDRVKSFSEKIRYFVCWGVLQFFSFLFTISSGSCHPDDQIKQEKIM